MKETVDDLRALLIAQAAQVKEVTEEREWICTKLGVPPDTPMFSGNGKTLAGRLHVLDHQAHGYVAYIEAFKCDDKQGEIARLTVRAEKAEAELVTQAAQLETVRQEYETLKKELLSDSSSTTSTT